jgi:hypothetical protein
MEKAKIERFDRRAGTVVSSEMELSQPGATVAPALATGEEEEGPKTVLYWARRKGHVPAPARSGFRGEIHRGPHVDVVRTQGLDVVRAANGEPVKDKDGKEQPRIVRWPLSKIVTEAEYDAAVKRAYEPLADGGAVAVGENLSDAAIRMAEAEKRAAPKAAKPTKAEAEKSAARALAEPEPLATTESAHSIVTPKKG